MKTSSSDASSPAPPPPPPPPPLAMLPSSASSSVKEAPPLKSPARLQSHLPPSEKPFRQQLAEACWLKFGAPSSAEMGDQDPIRVGEDDGDFMAAVVSAEQTVGLLQDGPQCGMVALSMALGCLHKAEHGLRGHHPPTVEAVQRRALERGYSRLGELFSVRDMRALASEFLEAAKMAAEVAVEDARKLTSRSYVLAELLQGQSLFLVPYDADFSQQPCLKKGHKAHWGLVLGMAFKMDARLLEDGAFQRGGFFLTLAERKERREELLKTLGQPETPTDSEYFFLIVRQSKSRRLFLFESGQLVESCLNLAELAEDGGNSAEEFVLPEGGVREGLCGKMVVIRRTAETQ